MMCQHRFILCKECTILVSDADNGGTMQAWGQEVYGKSLYLPFNFIINLKLL